MSKRNKSIVITPIFDIDNQIIELIIETQGKGLDPKEQETINQILYCQSNNNTSIIKEMR